MENLKIIKPKITRSMNCEPPYEKDTFEWHAWLDLCSVGREMQVGEILDLNRAMKIHGTDLKYYKNALKGLIADGYITLIEITDAN